MSFGVHRDGSERDDAIGAWIHPVVSESSATKRTRSIGVSSVQVASKHV
jgi:hypothetical protein